MSIEDLNTVISIEKARELTKKANDFTPNQRIKYYNTLIERAAKLGKNYIQVRYWDEDEFVYEKLREAGFEVLQGENTLMTIVKISWREIEL